MLWRGEQPEVADVFKMAGINDRVQLEIRGRAYLSHVEDVRDNEMYVAAPLEQGTIVHVAPGQEVIINVFAGAGMRRFRGVAGRMVLSRASLIAVRGLSDMGDVERRDFVRVSDRLPIRFRIEDGHDSGKPWWNGITRDIGRGGVKIISPVWRQIKQGDFIDLDMPIPCDKPVQAIARVAGVSVVPTSAGTSTGYGVQFVEIGPAARSRIVQYVRKKQAAVIAACRPKDA